MVIEIKDKQGQTRVSVPIQEGAKGVFSLMNSDYIQLPFSSEDVISFRMGDYADLSGIEYEGLGGKIAKVYEIVDMNNVNPTYNESTGAYDYNIRLDAYYWKWKNKIFKYTPENAGQEASWSLTASLEVHLSIFLRNLKALGYTYKGTEFTFSIDSTVENKAIAVTYDNINLLDALFTLASKDYCNCDCWITDNVIHFGRNEFGDAVKIERGVEAASIGKSESKGTYATRIYAFGGTRNIPANYRPTDEQAVVNGVVQKRLMLPADTPYIDAYEGMSQEEAIEDIVVFDDIYPRRIGTMSSVATVDRDITEDGEVTGTFKAYQYKDTGLVFSEEYIIEGQELRIVFQSGKMNGMEFSVQFNPNNADPAEQLWEIIRNEDYGRPLPDDIIKPENGDTYILSGFDIQLVSDQYIPEAEQELKERAQKYADIAKKDDGTYPVKLFSDYVFSDPLRHNYEFGQRVNLIDKAYFENGRVSRIIGWEVKLDIPFDSPQYTVGESTSYSRIQEIEDKVESLTYKGQTYTGLGGSGVYIIKTNDSTAPSDSNVFSALRSIATFLRKDKEDSTRFLMKFLGGLISDNIESQNFASGALGTGFLIKRDPKTGKSYIEADEIYIRLKAYFDTLEIKHLSHVGGRIVLSPASMECIKVETISSDIDALYDYNGDPLYDIENSRLYSMQTGTRTVDVYRCYFKQSDDEKSIVNEFAIDDLAQCREFNVKSNLEQGVSNQYYWRRVVGVGTDYIDLSIDDCDAGSMMPKAGDTIVTIGNKTNTARQHVVFLSSYDDDAPCIKLYSGINDYSMLNKEVTVISPNADKNVFTGKVVIKPGSEGFGNLTDAPDIGLIESEIENAKNDAKEAIAAATEAMQDVTDLNDYVDGAFSDGIISEAEAKAIEKYINTIRTSYLSAEKEYSELYNNSYLSGIPKTNLKSKYDALSTATAELLTSITLAISDGKTTTEEKEEVDTCFSTFNEKYGEFAQAIEEANKAIQDKLKGYSDNAQIAADEAKADAAQAVEDANQAKTDVTNLNNYVDGAFADGIISQSEAMAIEKYINTVNSTKQEVDATYTKLYNNTYLTGTAKDGLFKSKTEFDTATSNLIKSINTAISDGKTTQAEKEDVDSKFSAFNTSYANFATAIETANKAIQDEIKKQASDEAKENALTEINKVSEEYKEDIAEKLGYGNYAELEAFASRGETIISGGSINTKLINATLIVTSALIANAIKSKELNVNDNFIVKTDGSVDLEGIIRSKGINTELVLSDGYMRIMYNNNEVLRLSVNESTGLPELNMSYQGKTLYATPSVLSFGMGGGQFLRLDPAEIGSGVIMKDSENRLYLATQSYQYITVYLRVSPEGAGKTSPFNGGSIRLIGSSETISAIANEGYEFERWSDGGAQTHTVSWTDGSSITAYFTKKEVIQYKLTVAAMAGGTVSPSGINYYNAGTKVQITAKPNAGYIFNGWLPTTYGNSETIEVIMDAEKGFIASFKKIEENFGEELLPSWSNNSYWDNNSDAKVTVSTSDVTIGSASNNLSSPTGFVIFGVGYLQNKLKSGKKYRLTFECYPLSTTDGANAIISSVGKLNKSQNNADSDISDNVIYGEKAYSGKWNTFTLDMTMKSTSDAEHGVLFYGINGSIEVRNISLKELL